MRGFLLRWVINIIALMAVLNIAPGIHIDRLETTIIAAFILGLLNVFLKPIIVFLTLPINILSLGFFTLIINGFMLYIVAQLVRGFTISSFWDAFWGALFFSIISFLLNLFISPQGRVSFHEHRNHYPHSHRYSHRYHNVIDVEGEVEGKEERGERDEN